MCTSSEILAVLGFCHINPKILDNLIWTCVCMCDSSVRNHYLDSRDGKMQVGGERGRGQLKPPDCLLPEVALGDLKDTLQSKIKRA